MSDKPPMQQIVNNQPALQPVYVTHKFSDHPQQVTCPRCNVVVTTAVDHKPGLLTWLLCGGLACFGCFLGCCLIPFCVDGAKDVEHDCPRCGEYLGLHKRI